MGDGDGENIIMRRFHYRNLVKVFCSASIIANSFSLDFLVNFKNNLAEWK